MTLNAKVSALAGRRGTLVWTAVGVVALLIFGASFIRQLSKNPLRMDEVDYFQSMRNIVALGVPIYYAGEVELDASRLLYLSTRQLGGQTFDFYRFKPETGILKETFFAVTDGSSRYTYGMWHPPLYIYLGSFAFRLAFLSSDNSILLRYFNLVFSIGLFAGLVLLSKQLYPRLYQPVAAAALVLYSLNRLAVAGSLLIDYNATLGPCVAVWFAVTFLRSQQRRGLHWGLIVLTIGAFFVSLGIGVCLVISTLLYVAVIGYRTKPWYAVASILLGSTLFLPAFLIFCRALSLPFSQPFLHNMVRLGARADPGWLLAGLKAGIVYGYWYATALGLPLALAAAVLLARKILTGKAQSDPSSVFLPVTVFMGLVLQGSLRADAYGFPKYVLFLVPLLMVFVAGEAITLFHASRSTSMAWSGAISLLLAVILVSEAAASLKDLQGPGGTLYLPGEAGVMEVSQRLRLLSSSSDVVLSPKDVAFFADRKFVPWSDSLLHDVKALRARVQQENIRYVVVPASVLAASNDVADYLKNEFVLQAAEGDYWLLRSRAEPPPTARAPDASLAGNDGREHSIGIDPYDATGDIIGLVTFGDSIAAIHSNPEWMRTP